MIAIDWGTTSLRGARLDTAGKLLDERAAAQGILSVQPGQFATVLEAAYDDWIKPGVTLTLISGMAGSKQGWVEAPYCPCPAGFDEVAARLTKAGKLVSVAGAIGYSMIVARRDKTFFADVTTLAQQLASARCAVIGSVLSEF